MVRDFRPTDQDGNPKPSRQQQKRGSQYAQELANAGKDALTLTPAGVYYITPDQMPYGPPLDICPECLLSEITDRVEGGDPEIGQMYRLVSDDSCNQSNSRYCQSFRHSEEV